MTDDHPHTEDFTQVDYHHIWSSWENFSLDYKSYNSPRYL